MSIAAFQTRRGMGRTTVLLAVALVVAVPVPAAGQEHAGLVEGTVIDADTGVAIRGILVEVLDQTGTLVGDYVTGESGGFAVWVDVPLVEIRFSICDCSLWSGPTYAPETYHNKRLPGTSMQPNWISVPHGVSVSVDAALHRKGYLYGQIADDTGRRLGSCVAVIDRHGMVAPSNGPRGGLRFELEVPTAVGYRLTVHDCDRDPLAAPEAWFRDASGFNDAVQLAVTVGRGTGPITITVGGPDGPIPPVPDVFPYDDFSGSTFEEDILWLTRVDVTRGCNPPLNTFFCPGNVVTRGQMAAFLSRALGLPDSGSAGFVDTEGHRFEADIDRLASAEITKGCNPPANDRYCPDASVTREQMAALLARALELPAPVGSDAFSDDDGSIFEREIEALATAGITRGCNPPANDRFCPGAPVTRAQMAAFLHRAFET